LAVRLTGPRHSVARDGLLDTGSDDTVFPDAVAAAVGIDLTQAPEFSLNLAARGLVQCRYAIVSLLISDGRETFEWSAIVGFVSVPLLFPLLGHAGFLQFFDAEFRGADHEVILMPNRDFTGRRI
jgi:hypothetical protein